jgi:hypothetical protein
MRLGINTRDLNLAFSGLSPPGSLKVLYLGSPTMAGTFNDSFSSQPFGQ